MSKSISFVSLLELAQEYISQNYAAALTEKSKFPQIKTYLEKYLRDNGFSVDGMSTAELTNKLYSEMAEYSILTKYLGRDEIEEINVNGWDDVAITFTDGHIEKAAEHFFSPQHAVDIVKRLLHHSGMIIDNATPMSQGHLPGNTRITALKEPLVDDDRGISVSIRLLHPSRVNRVQLICGGNSTQKMIDFLCMCLRYGISFVVAGATSSGKTTLLNALLTSIPDNKRIFTIESGSRELSLLRIQDGKVQNNVVHTLSRPSDNEAYDITQEDLVVASLRFNPDVVVIGEMRDTEAYSAVEASLIGHTVVSTIHASAADAAHTRLALLCQKRFPIVKDMSRLGRNYLEVGQLTETVFPMHNIRFIAVNDNVDSAHGEDDFTPFRNIMNEWYAKDMSRKMRSALHTKSKQGYAVGQPPLGYKYSDTDRKRWEIDPEGADIVRHIYTMRREGTSINDIAKILKREKVLIPSVYAQRKGFKNPTKKAVRGEFLWDTSMVRKLLMNRSYVGDVINFRTYSKSFKLKDRLANPEENWEIHENVHEPIIDRSVWDDIQKSFGQTKYRKPKHIEKNMFSGFLKCSDCGANLNYKYTHDNPDNHYFSCRNKRANNGLCSQTHHIRVDAITKIVTQNISNIVRFASQFEDEFVKIVMDEQYKQVVLQQRKNQTALQEAIAREKEVDVLYEKLFEEKILGNLTEERFKKLSYKYEDEQSELKQKIKHLKEIVANEKAHEMNADGFLSVVRKYTDITELTPEILHEFIDKIVVHHREQVFGETVQKVEIYYKMIGYVELPQLSKTERESLKVTFGRKEAEEGRKIDRSA